MGVNSHRQSAITPQQNVVCERHSGVQARRRDSLGKSTSHVTERFQNASDVRCAELVTSLRYDRALSQAVLARFRAHGADRARQLFQVGDVVYYWQGNGKAKRARKTHWHGPATIIGLQRKSL